MFETFLQQLPFILDYVTFKQGYYEVNNNQNSDKYSRVFAPQNRIVDEIEFHEGK